MLPREACVRFAHGNPANGFPCRLCGRRRPQQAARPPRRARLVRGNDRRRAGGVSARGRAHQPGLRGQGRHLAVGARAPGAGLPLRDPVLRPRQSGSGPPHAAGRPGRAGRRRPRLPRGERLPGRAGAQRDGGGADHRGDHRQPALLDGLGERLGGPRARPGQARRADGIAPAAGARPQALGPRHQGDLATSSPSGGVFPSRTRRESWCSAVPGPTAT